MIVKNENQIRRLGKLLKNEDARITGVLHESDDNLYYIIEDLIDQETVHVPIWKRPTWSKKISTFDEEKMRWRSPTK